ncbi:hypothetical protein EVAR_8186_1 [Eumeta japonica]|uniref:Uncharacterized protein n=1 Tax=Eumeta variegata TaxID=151549 RepID=A0A4C1TFG0_EUMVA|nr:hypothetical protein EVAR_8186_1 [Eumeta japonica]
MSSRRVAKCRTRSRSVSEPLRKLTENDPGGPSHARAPRNVLRKLIGPPHFIVNKIGVLPTRPVSTCVQRNPEIGEPNLGVCVRCAPPARPPPAPAQRAGRLTARMEENDVSFERTMFARVVNGHCVYEQRTFRRRPFGSVVHNAVRVSAPRSVSCLTAIGSHRYRCPRRRPPLEAWRSLKGCTSPVAGHHSARGSGRLHGTARPLDTMGA